MQEQQFPLNSGVRVKSPMTLAIAEMVVILL